MSELLTPSKTDQGWVLTMVPEMARAAGVAEGSLIVLYLKGSGTIAAEILPPASEATKRSVEESVDKFGDAFAEMKRLGD